MIDDLSNGFDRLADLQAVFRLLPEDHPWRAEHGRPRPPEFVEGAEWVVLADLPNARRGQHLRLIRYRSWRNLEYETDGEGYVFAGVDGGSLWTTTEHWQGRLPCPRWPTMSILSWREALVTALVVPVSCSLATDRRAAEVLARELAALLAFDIAQHSRRALHR